MSNLERTYGDELQRAAERVMRRARHAPSASCAERVMRRERRPWWRLWYWLADRAKA